MVDPRGCCYCCCCCCCYCYCCLHCHCHSNWYYRWRYWMDATEFPNHYCHWGMKIVVCHRRSQCIVHFPWYSTCHPWRDRSLWTCIPQRIDSILYSRERGYIMKLLSKWSWSNREDVVRGDSSMIIVAEQISIVFLLALSLSLTSFIPTTCRIIDISRWPRRHGCPPSSTFIPLLECPWILKSIFVRP